jgi:putative flippase GtrA
MPGNNELLLTGLLTAVQLIQLALIEELLVPELAGVAAGMVIYTGAGFVLNSRLVFGGVGLSNRPR